MDQYVRVRDLIGRITRVSRRTALDFGTVVSLAALLVIGTPAYAQHLPGGGGGDVLLRYQFAPGQRTTYQVAYTQLDTFDLSSHDNPGPFLADLIRFGPTTFVVGSQEHERILSIDAHGNAHIALSVDHVTVTVNERKQPSSPPTALGVFTVAPNGTQLAGGDERKDADRAENGPILPTYPVAVGARWTTHLSLAVPGAALLVRHVTSEDTLVGFGQIAGEPVAIVDAHIPLQARGIITLGGGPASVQQAGIETQRFFIGLDSGLLVFSRGHITTNTVIRQDGGTLHETLQLVVTQQRVSFTR